MTTESELSITRQRARLVAETKERLHASTITDQQDALDTIRHEGIDELFDELLALLSSTQNQELTRQIVDLLIDARSSLLVDAIGNALKAENLPTEYLAQLLSLCWQSLLDFSPILSQLIPYLRHPDLQVVIEAVTSVEIALDHASKQALQDTIPTFKQYLAQEKQSAEGRRFLEELLAKAQISLQQQANSEREARTNHSHHHHHTCECDHENEDN